MLNEKEQAIEEYDLGGLLELNDLRGNKPDEIVIELTKEEKFKL